MTIKSDIEGLSKEQVLVYTGAAVTTACGFASGAFAKKNADRPVSDSNNTKLLTANGLNVAAIAALQAVSAHEKPSARMVALNGALHTAAGVLTGVETYQNKAIKQDIGGVVCAGQVALGSALIGRAIWMRRNSPKEQVEKIGDKVKNVFGQ